LTVKGEIFQFNFVLREKTPPGFSGIPCRAKDMMPDNKFAKWNFTGRNGSGKTGKIVGK